MKNTISWKRSTAKAGFGAGLCLLALGSVACGQAAPEPASTGSAPVLREPSAMAVAALERHGKRPPPAGLRRATPEEVTAKFGRMNAARERARVLAAQPENLDDLLARIAAAPKRTERASLTHRYLAAANALGASERPAAIQRLEHAIASAPSVRE